MSSLSLSIRLACLNGAIFLALGLFLPFWPLYLEGRGLDAAAIGSLLAAAAWIKVVGVPFWGRLADPPGRGRPTLALLALGAAATYGLLGEIDVFAWLLIGHLFLGFFANPLIPIADSQIIATVRERGVDYGRIRLWGSLTFIAGNFLGGALIEAEPRALYLGAIVAAMLLAALAAWSLPPRPKALPRAALDGESWRSLLSNRPFLLVVLIGGFMQASHGAYYAISAIAWRAAGISDGTIAWLWAEGVLVEVVLLAFAGRLLRRLGIKGLFILAGAAGTIRWTAMGATNDLAVLALVQCLHALTFAAAHLAAVMAIGQCVPPHRLSSGQAVYTALQSGIMVGAALWLSALLYEAAGQFPAYAAMALLSGLGLLTALLAGRFLPETPRKSALQAGP